MIRPDDAFLARAATRERAILSACIGHPVGTLAPVNDDQRGYDPLDDAIQPFAHCHECGVWLRPSEGCLHIPANVGER